MKHSVALLALTLVGCAHTTSRRAAARAAPAKSPYGLVQLRADCAHDEPAACAALAAKERALSARRAQTIYQDVAIPRLAVLASNTKACQLGDWASCDALAEPCPEAGQAGVRPYAERAHALADQRCLAADLDACAYAAARDLGACGTTTQRERGMDRLGRALAPLAATCTSGDWGACSDLMRRCRNAAAVVPACAVPQVATEAGCRNDDTRACETLGEVTRATLTEASASLLVAEVLGKRCDAAPARSCASAGRAALRGGGAVARARTWLTRGCTSGEASACGLLGCQGRLAEDGASWDPRLGTAAPGLCERACERGDDLSCLVLGGVDPDDLGGVDLDNRWITKVSLRAAAACDSGPSCAAAGQPEDDGSPYPTPLTAPAYVWQRATLEKGCRLGSAEACTLLVDLLTQVTPDATALIAEVQAKAAAAEALAQAPTPEAPAEEDILVLASQCRDGHCEGLCRRASELLPSGVGFVQAERQATLAELLPISALVPELTPEGLQDTCIEVELDDPCACGCC